MVVSWCGMRAIFGKPARIELERLKVVEMEGTGVSVSKWYSRVSTETSGGGIACD